MRKKVIRRFPNASWILAFVCFMVFLILFAITERQWARQMSMYTGIITVWFVMWRLINMKLDKIRAHAILKYFEKYDKN